VAGGGRPAAEEEPTGPERGAIGRKENERKKKIGGAHMGKMVISLVGLTP
jgi:hypothetical protein